MSLKWLSFPVAVLALYLLLWSVAPEKTLLAAKSSVNILWQVLRALGLVFLLMIGLNLFLKPSRLTRYLTGRAGITQKLLAAVAGIISTGPIYAWYPMLKDLREKGAAPSLLAIFLVNRAVKPLLLPVMISFFGWLYVLFFMFLIVAGSLGVGSIVAVVVRPSDIDIGLDPVGK